MTWQIVAAFSAVIGAAYLVISWLIARGLWATRQAGPNVLGVATAAIFFTCGVHHGSHALHLIGPTFGFEQAKAWRCGRPSGGTWRCGTSSAQGSPCST